MAYSARSITAFVAGIVLVVSLATAVRAQSTQYPKPTELPNPYRLVESWPTLPESMNGGRWGEVIRVHVHSDGNIWVFHRCFNTSLQAMPRVSGGAMPIRRFWNSLRRASFSRALAWDYSPILTLSRS